MIFLWEIVILALLWKKQHWVSNWDFQLKKKNKKIMAYISSITMMMKRKLLLSALVFGWEVEQYLTNEQGHIDYSDVQVSIILVYASTLSEYLTHVSRQ